MPYKITNVEVAVEVTDEPRLRNWNSDEADEFVPVHAKVVMFGDDFERVDVTVKGPLISAVTGRPARTKLGVASFDQDDLDSAPAWVVELVKEVRS